MKRCIIILMLGLTMVISGCHRDERPQKIYTEVKSVNKLMLAQMTITKMAVVDDVSMEDANGFKQTVAAITDAFKIGDRKAAYSYNTYLRAYIDMKDFESSDILIDDKHKTIILNLPDVKTEYAGRDMEIKEEHYRVSGLRSDISASERASLKEKMNESLKKEVEENPQFREKLESQARGKAKDYFTSLLGKDGYNVIVNFKSPIL